MEYKNRVCVLCGLILVGFFACREPNCPDSIVVIQPPDAGLADAEELDGTKKPSACGDACVQLAKLGCPESTPKPGEESCFIVCTRAEETKRFSLKPACIAKAATVAEVRACGTVRCGSKAQ